MNEREVLTSQWKSVADALKILCVAPFQFTEGLRHEFPVLLPQFGAARGVLIDVEYNREAVTAAVAAGFTHSTMGAEVHHLPLDPLNYIDCLLDWGWSASGELPQWYAAASRDA